MKKTFRAFLLLVLTLGAAIFAGAYFFDFGRAKESAVVYDAAEASLGSIRRAVSTSGPVRALVTVSVGSQLSGIVETVAADFNTEVKAGALLASLDTRTFGAKVAQAKADLAAADASVVNQEALLAKGEAVLRQAERVGERQKTLAARGFSAQASLDTAIRDSEVAKAEIAVARAMIANARAVVEQRQAALEQADVDFARARILSPIDGTVISRTVDPGQTVAASLQAPELFKIAQDLRRVRIEAQVSEADIGSIAEDNPATFTVDAYPDRKFEGTVTQVRLSATELNNVVTYTVIVEATNEDRKLFPGMTANVEIETARRDGVLRVANDALRFRPRLTAADGEKRGERGGAERLNRRMERLKAELELTAEQEAAVRAALSEVYEGMRKESTGLGPGGPDADQMRQRSSAKIEQVLSPMLSDKQRPLFDRWKAGRETSRPGAVWVLNGGRPERRSVRLGVNDEQFTEIAGGELKEGDRVVLRAREPKT